jgi:hypothetical protein
MGEALGHDYKVTVTTPTCTSKGYATHVCSRCAATRVDGLKDMTPHTPGEWTVHIQPTETKAGEQRRFCTVCGTATHSEPLPPTGVPGEDTAPDTEEDTRDPADTAPDTEEDTRDPADTVADTEAGTRDPADTAPAGDTNGEDTTLGQEPTDSDTDEESYTSIPGGTPEPGGCNRAGKIGAYVLIAALMLAALFLFWFIGPSKH